MNRFKTTLRLLAACFIAGISLWFLNRHEVKGSSTSLRHSERLFQAPLRSVDRLTIARRGERPFAFRLAPDGSWKVESPIVARANIASIKRLTDALEAARVEDFIDENEMRNRAVSYADFGLEPPAGTITLGGPRGNFAEISFGASTVTSNSLFAAMRNHPGVFVTSPDILEFLGWGIEKYADVRVIAGDPRLVESIAFRRPGLGYLKLVRRGPEWHITQPFETRADWTEMTKVFDTLYQARLLRIVFDGDRADYGFESPDAVQVQLFGHDDATGRALTIGSAVPGGADEYYARPPEGDAVIVVPGAVRRIALLSAASLRDRRLFPSRGKLSPQSVSISSGGGRLALARSEDGWEMTSPVAEKADASAVATLLNSILGLCASGFAPAAPDGAPAATLTVALPDGVRRLAIHVPAASPASSPSPEGEPAPSSTASAGVRGQAPSSATPSIPVHAGVRGQAPSSATPSIPVPAGVRGQAPDLLPPGDAPLSVVLSREGRSDDVFLVPPSQFSAAIAALSDPRPLLDRTVLAIPAASIQRVTVVHLGGTTNVVARDANGLFAPPQGHVLAAEDFKSLLSAAENLRAERVEAVDPEDLLPYGLDLPAFEVAFDLADEAGLRRTLAIGSRTPDNRSRYAAVKGHDLVFVLPREAADAFMRPLLSRETPEIGAAPSL